jgi:hypothetical protein
MPLFSLPYKGDRFSWAVRCVGWSNAECAWRLKTDTGTLTQMFRDKRFMPDVLAFWIESLAAIHANSPAPTFLWQDPEGRPDRDVGRIARRGGLRIDTTSRPPIPTHFSEPPGPLSLPYKGSRMAWALDIIGWNDPVTCERINVTIPWLRQAHRDQEPIPDALALWLEGLAAVHIALPYPIGWRAWSTPVAALPGPSSLRD